MRKKQEARLENWTVRKIGPHLQVMGHVYGHPRFRNGEFIYSSQVINFNKNFRTVETLNTFYTLGEPAEVVGEENYN